MKKGNTKDWIDEFIWSDDLSDEAICAVYNFLEQVLIRYQIKASYKLRRYMEMQEEIVSNRCCREEENIPPF